MLRGLIESIESKKKDTQSDNAASTTATQLILKRPLSLLSSSPLLSQKLEDLTVSPLKKTVKFNSALAQFCEDEEDDVDLLALLEDFDHSELKSASPRPVALTQTVLTNESFDSGILFSGNDSLFDTSFNESPAIQTINPGFSAEVSKNVPKIDDQIEDDEILSLSSMLPADSAVLKSNYVPQLITPESFSLKQLEYNIKNINPSLALNSLSSLFTVDDPPRRLKGPAALMAQKIRKIGPATQITFIDGTGTEILGTLCNTDCKVHYGMIFILQDVSVFSPIPGVKFLNIIANNIVSVYENVHRIN